MKSLFLRFVQYFSPAQQPVMSRPAFSRELVTAGTLPFAVAMLEGGVVGVVSKTIFNVSDLGFAAIFAAPMFANVTSLLWARLSRGKAKVAFTTMIMAVLLMLVASVAFLPTGGMGPGMLVLIVVLGRVCMAGMVALRSTIWRMNYTRSVRGQATARFVMLASLILALWPIFVGPLLDANAELFRVLYPFSAILGALGVLSFWQIRVRGERQLLRDENQPDVSDAPLQPNGKPHNALSVLRHDTNFRSYMVWQFLAGVGNMAGSTAFALFVINTLKDTPTENTQSMLLNATIPLGLAVVSLSWWARRLDGLHITRFRVIHGVTWVINQGLNGLAAWTGWLPLLYLASGAHGVARGGGMLAWQLGHNDFADRRLVALYMGIHQALTGVRGIFAPFVGTLLLTGWQPFTIAGQTFRGWEGIGAGVFVVTTAAVFASWLGFWSLNLKLRRDGSDAAKDME
ncbi:MAG: MFS transporter [Planctomycetota bacterium]